MKQHINDFHKRVNKSQSERWFDNIALKYGESLFNEERRKILELHCRNIKHWELLEGFGDWEKIALVAQFMNTLLQIANNQQQHNFSLDVAYLCLSDSFDDTSWSHSLSKEEKESTFREYSERANKASIEVHAWASKRAEDWWRWSWQDTWFDNEYQKKIESAEAETALTGYVNQRDGSREDV